MRKALENLSIFCNEKSVGLTISKGVSQNSKDTLSFDDFLKRADSTLYEAKGAGRNRVVFK